MRRQHRSGVGERVELQNGETQTAARAARELVVRRPFAVVVVIHYLGHHPGRIVTLREAIAQPGFPICSLPSVRQSHPAGLAPP